VHDEKDVEHGSGDVPKGAVPAYLLDREGVTSAKVLSNTVKQKRKEKAGKWAVPLPKVKPIAGASVCHIGARGSWRATCCPLLSLVRADDEMFKTIITGKKKSKSWKRMVTKVTFVGDNFTRKPPK
jgi:ribosome biogenesis protein NSA2